MSETGTVRTAEQQDALLMMVAETATAAVIKVGGRPYILTEDDDGDFWGWSYREEGETHPSTPALDLPLPWEVLDLPDPVSHSPCCSSHGVRQTCEQYRKTHFVEVRPCCSLDTQRATVLGLPMRSRDS